MFEVFIAVSKFTMFCFLAVAVFCFLIIPLFTAIFHEPISYSLKIKVGGNGKRNCSIYSENYSVDILSAIAKEDPRFSDILMYRMRIEQAQRNIRIAKRKKQHWKIKDFENMIFVNEGRLENAMKMYIEENPSEYNHPKNK